MTRTDGNCRATASAVPSMELLSIKIISRDVDGLFFSIDRIQSMLKSRVLKLGIRMEIIGPMNGAYCTRRVDGSFGTISARMKLQKKLFALFFLSGFCGLLY